MSGSIIIKNIRKTSYKIRTLFIRDAVKINVITPIEVKTLSKKHDGGFCAKKVCTSDAGENFISFF